MISPTSSPSRLKFQRHEPAPAPDVSDLDTLVALADQRRTGSPSTPLPRLRGEPRPEARATSIPRNWFRLFSTLRVKARSEKNFSLADEIRDIIVASGIDVMDTPDGSTWALK